MQTLAPSYRLIELILGKQEEATADYPLRDAALVDTWLGLQAIVQYVDANGAIQTERVTHPNERVRARETPTASDARVRITTNTLTYGIIPRLLFAGRSSITKDYELNLPKDSPLYKLRSE